MKLSVEPHRNGMVAMALLVSLLVTSSVSSSAFPVVDSIPLQGVPPYSRLAIWGDSITETTLYPRYVEIYLLACAGRKDVSVCTFGHSGERLGGPISRQSDLECFHPTLVSILYGMNDSEYAPYTVEKGAAFDKTMKDVLALLAAKRIRQVIVAGPTAVDDLFTPADFFHGADSHGLTAAQGQNLTLEHFRDFARAEAVATGSAFADVHNRMVDSYDAAKHVLGPTYTFGVVHPAPNGHLMIAYELLKTMACKGDIATIDVDMKGHAQASVGHSIVSSEVGPGGGVVVVDSSRYPFCYNYDPYTSRDATGLATILPYLPFSKDLNRFMLKVSNLNVPSAHVTWGGETKSFTRDQLAAGVNLAAEFSHTPFDAAFARVMQAITAKQEFENFMIKGTSNYFGNDNGGNFDENMISIDRKMDADLKTMIMSVRHTIVIVPEGAPETGPPVITSVTTLFATVGQDFDYRMTSLFAPTGYSATGLPDGLSIDTSSGEISGKPSALGTCLITVKAANAHGVSAAKLTLVVSAPLPERPAITSPDTASAVVGTAFSYQITADHDAAAFFATSPSDRGVVPPASSLPPGLNYNSSTGLVSGIPQHAGTYIIQVAAMNASGVTAKQVTLTVKDK